MKVQLGMPIYRTTCDKKGRLIGIWYRVNEDGTSRNVLSIQSHNKKGDKVRDFTYDDSPENKLVWQMYLKNNVMRKWIERKWDGLTSYVFRATDYDTDGLPVNVTGRSYTKEQIDVLRADAIRIKTAAKEQQSSSALDNLNKAFKSR